MSARKAHHGTARPELSEKAQAAVAAILELDPYDQLAVVDRIDANLETMVFRGVYGLVKVIDGKHSGRFGEYDDDDADGAIVMFLDDKWGEDSLPLKNLRRLTDAEQQAVEEAGEVKRRARLAQKKAPVLT